MTFLSMATWQVWLMSGLTTAIVIWLFFLKQRHPRFVVGSLILWKRVLENRQTESWIERLRRLISLLIALAIALLMMLALGRPLLEVLMGPQREFAIVLDTSLTLAAQTSTGSTRWENARLHARRIIKTASPGDRFLIADTSGVVVTPTTIDPKVALATIDKMAPVTVSPRFPEITTSDADLIFISDGVAIHDVPVNTQSISVFEPADNVGITAFEVRPVPVNPLSYEAYLEITNYSPQTKTVTLEIGGREQAKLLRSIELDKGQTSRQTLELSAFEGGEIQARILVEGDSLLIDNTAFAYLPSRRRLRVALVTDGNHHLETLLNLDPRVDLVTMRPNTFRENTDIDAYIFDRFITTSPPSKPVLIFHPTSASWVSSTSNEVEVDGISNLNDQHLIMRFVPFTDLSINKAVHLDIASATPVAMADETPLIVAGETPERHVIVAFDLNDSGFANTLGFPIFIRNVLNWFTGEVPPLYRQLGTVTVPGTSGYIISATGEPVASSQQLNSTVFDTSTPGLFMAITDNTRVPVAVNVISRKLSNINQSNFSQMNPSPSSEYVPPKRESWFYMLLLAILLICAEWLTYHRRITI